MIHAQRLARLRADGDIHRIVGFRDLAHFMQADGALAPSRNGSGRQNPSNVLVKPFARKAICRDAVAKHAAKLLAGFEYRHPMPHERKEVRAG